MVPGVLKRSMKFGGGRRDDWHWLHVSAVEGLCALHFGHWIIASPVERMGIVL